MRIFLPGKPPREAIFDGDSAVIGRSADCDIVVESPLVSKRHARILRGIVVVDLGSSNGTSVDGRKIDEATLCNQGTIGLGDDLIHIEVDGGAEEKSSRSIAEVRAELERVRVEKLALLEEIEALRSNLRGGEQASSQRVHDLEIECADLRRRLETLRSEIEGRETEAAGDLHVRLAQARQLELQHENDRLRKTIAELEASALHIAGGRVDPASAARLVGLETALRECEANARRVEGELAAEKARATSPQSALAASEFFQRLVAENAQLRKNLTELRSKSERAAPLAGELFQSLSAENEALRRRIAEIEAQAVEPAPGDARRMLADRNALELELAKMRTENEQLRAAARSHAPAARSDLVQVRVHDLLVHTDDVEAATRRLDSAGSDEFLVLESLLFLRQVERLVTRIVGGFVQIHAPVTMLPQSGRSFRQIANELARPGAGANERRAIHEHLEQLGVWLAVAISAPKQAALQFAATLKDDLTERRLTEREPIPKVKRLAGQADAELWKRVGAYFFELSPERIEDRIDDATRVCAQELYEAARRERG